MRISPISSMRRVAAGYVELFKNMPLTIIMVFMVLGVFAQLKISFRPVSAGCTSGPACIRCPSCSSRSRVPIRPS